MKDKSAINNAAENIIKKIEKAVENFPGTEIVFDYSEDYALKKSSLVLVSFIGLEEIININSNEKILIDEKSKDDKT